MVKTKTNFINSLLQSGGMAALAIVLIFVSLGAVMLPNLFADTATRYGAPTVSATPSNTATYAVKVSWKGQTSTKWTYDYLVNGRVVATKVVDDSVTSATISGLTCGATYTFRVAAASSSGTALSSYGSDTAVTRCPTATFTSFTASGNSVIAKWANTSFATGYHLFLKAGSGAYVSHYTTATSLTVGGSCGTTYAAYVSAGANSQYGPSTPVKTIGTAACPVAPKPAPAPTPPAPTPTPPKTTTKKTTSSSKAVATAPTTATPAPAVPGNFAADVQSEKIVTLSWDADSGNIKQYVINRSTDSTAWVLLTTTTANTYTDNTAAFDTTYYYQIQAIGSDGQASGTATTQATTNSFTSSDSTVTSDDKSVQIVVPSGAINQNFNCTLSTDTDDLVNVPAGQKVILGPYDLLCIGGDGSVIDTFSKPLQVTMKTSSAASGYNNLSAKLSSDHGWNATKSTYNAKNKTINFTLTSAKTFAAFGQKHSSPVGAIIVTLLLLLLVGGAVVGFVIWRKRTPARVVAAVSQASAEQEFKAALAKPDCSHKTMAQPVTPSSQGCLECEQQHTQWTALRICLICGHVGCSDDSPEQHAYKHFQQTGHPIVYDYADPNGNNIGWCYIDQTYI